MTAAAAPRGPASRRYVSQRLRLHYVDWGNEAAAPLLLVHGGRDHCRNWDWIAQALRDEYRIIAPDLRGHGDSQWMIGGTYRMSDYVYDIAQLVHQTIGGPLSIVGHSLGGMIGLRYAGLYPERVRRVVAIEGLGPPPAWRAERLAKPMHRRLTDWVAEVRGLSARLPRRYPSLEAAWRRMHEENPHLSPEQARHLTVHGVNRNEDGTYGWKFDNYVRVFAATGLPDDELYALWRRIACPVMLVRGTESWAGDPREDGRARHFNDARCIDLVGAGHWAHHDRLDAFLAHVRPFLAGAGRQA